MYFLDKNNALFKNEEKLIDDHTIVALTIMIAESNPERKRDDGKCCHELYEIIFLDTIYYTICPVNLRRFMKKSVNLGQNTKIEKKCRKARNIKV